MKMKFGFALVAILVVCFSSVTDARGLAKKSDNEMNLLNDLRSLLLKIRDEDPPKPIACRIRDDLGVIREVECPGNPDPVACPVSDPATNEVGVSISLGNLQNAGVHLTFCNGPPGGQAFDYQDAVAKFLGHFVHEKDDSGSNSDERK